MIRSTIIPLLLMAVMPFFMFVLWSSVKNFDGSILDCLTEIYRDPEVFWHEKLPKADIFAFKIVGVWLALQLVLLVILPGKEFIGPKSEKGTQPKYKINGILNYFVSFGVFLYITEYKRYFDPWFLYDNMGGIIVAVSYIAPALLVFLWIKAKLFPSTADCESSGNIITDFYWGLELYPSFLGISFKQLINCRFAMMGWNLLIYSFMRKSQAIENPLNPGWPGSYAAMVSCALQTIYIFKFFVWEDGYFTSIDIMHDKFGFYICWGCMVYLPTVYTLVSFYLAEHSPPTAPGIAVLIFIVGLICIWINYDIDAQRLRFRQGNFLDLIWGEVPKYVSAKYKTADGTTHSSKLLYSGWWGMARHLNYLFELGLAFCWTLPVQGKHLIPWYYFIFLTILLFDRAIRDEIRCSKKYGKAYNEYRKVVPYLIIPGIW